MWDIKDEVDFFRSSMTITDIDRVMYNINNDYYAFAPKGVSLANSTVQSRNSLLGTYTEKWCKTFISDIAEKLGLYPVNGVICPEIELKPSSPADLALCTRNATHLRASEIKIIFEIKMGVINNYTYNMDTEGFDYIGDFTSHAGRPSLLRSDSMLKAIGKALNIRVCEGSRNIPIVVLGNSPITSTYIHKVDNLKTTGVIQHFISLYPNPTSSDYIVNSPQNGFCTVNDKDEFELIITSLLSTELNYFSSMKSYNEIGKIVSLAAQEMTDEQKGIEFLKQLRANG